MACLHVVTLYGLLFSLLCCVNVGAGGVNGQGVAAAV